MADEAPAWTPYRYAFDNPIRFIDPDSLFEDEAAARAYAKDNGIKIRPKSFIGMLFTSGSRHNLVENSDGSFSLQKGNTSIQDLGGDLGVMESLVVTPTDVVDSRIEQGDLFSADEWVGTLRDGTESREPWQPFVAGTAPSPGKINKNSLKAVGNFVIKISGKTFKVGKADAGRITQSSGLPTRIHSQMRKLRKQHGSDAIDVSISPLGKTTTREALRTERSILKKIFKRTGKVPPGNQKSFKPK